MKLIPGMIFYKIGSTLRDTIIDVSGEQLYYKDREGTRFMIGKESFFASREFSGELEQELVPVGTKLRWTMRGGITSMPFIKEGHSYRDDQDCHCLCVYMNKVGGFCRASDVVLELDNDDGE